MELKWCLADKLKSIDGFGIYETRDYSNLAKCLVGVEKRLNKGKLAVVHDPLNTRECVSRLEVRLDEF